MKFFPLVFLSSFFCFSQNQYPKDYFVPPLEIPMQLSGNFGELRDGVRGLTGSSGDD
jgi:hypothetical protein